MRKVSVTESLAPPRAAWPINEGAHRMGVSRVTVYKLAAKGELKLIKIGGRSLIPDSEVVRLTTLAPAGA